LIYIDDILCVYHCPGTPVTKSDEYFKTKEGSIQVPTLCLGAKLEKTVLPNGAISWGISSSKYVQSYVHSVHDYLEALPGDKKLLLKASTPFEGGYKPDIDESPALDPIMTNFYQSQIGMLRWCVELGRIAITTEVSIFFTYFFWHAKGTWTLCSICVLTLRCITMRGSRLALLTLRLIWVPFSRLI
jgi:hypothetical protein